MIQYRNGVYHYFLAAENLREKLITAWGLPEESYWNIGTSSPWLDGFEIIERKIVSAKKQKVKIKYYWLTSTGPAGATMETLTLVKDGAFWQVTEIN